MTIDQFLAAIDSMVEPALSSAALRLFGPSATPTPGEHELEAFEAEVGARLPEDYRGFLLRTSGGYIRDWYQFKGRTPEGATWTAFVCPSHVGGLRDDPNYSLRFARSCHQADPGPQRGPEIKIPRVLLWIMDDPGGNAVCLGLTGTYRGKVYFWVHDYPPSDGEWDGTVETAENITLVADSFTDFVAGIGPPDDSASDDGL
jgi:hypothetical protein